MQFVADLHLHSKYARAVSPQMTIPVMAQYGLSKGLDVLSCADFLHPVWFKEMKSQLTEAEEGLYRFVDQHASGAPRFLLSTEISSIYKQDNKLRRIHNLIFVSSLDAAEKLSRKLVSLGCNLNSDGRPIIGVSSKDLLEITLSVDEKSILIPAHIWTPHFGVLGSASGFDSLAGCYGQLSKYVYGIETGLSSDPDMNWQIKELENRSILSFSDAHSPLKMGREATVFDLNSLSFMAIRRAIMQPSNPQASGAKDTISYTIEFYPEEGRYHFSGHRKCKVVFGPEQIREQGNVCPVCHSRLTEGVLYRVEQLSDKGLCGRVKVTRGQNGVLWYSDRLGLAPSYVKLIPLLEVVAKAGGATCARQHITPGGPNPL
jgi:uncharacterized protein (TIGR00375 family)